MNILRFGQKSGQHDDSIPAAFRNRTFATGRRESTATVFDPNLLLTEEQILEKIMHCEETDRHAQVQLARAKGEQAQLQRAVVDLKNVIGNLQNQINETALTSAGPDGVSPALQLELLAQRNDVSKTTAENEHRALSETVRIMSERVGSLVLRREKRELEVLQLAGRVVSTQRAMQDPKSEASNTGAQAEIQTLAAKLAKLKLKVRELRALTTSKAMLLPKGSVERNAAADAIESQFEDINVKHSLAGIGDTIASFDVCRGFFDELGKGVDKLVTQHEGNKILAAKIARSEEEKLLMSSKALFTRVLSTDTGSTTRREVKGGRQVTTWRTAKRTEADGAELDRQAKVCAEKQLQDSMNKNRLFAQQLADERLKLSTAAKRVAADVDSNNALLEENAVLQAMVSQLAQDIAGTNDVLEKMSQQLETVRHQHNAESRNKDLWLCADADKLDQTLVATILAKEDELRDLQLQIAEMQHTTSKLGTRSLVGIASSPQQQQLQAWQTTRSQAALSAGSPLGGGGSGSPNASLGLSASAAVKSQLKRSMFMDL